MIARTVTSPARAKPIVTSTVVPATAPTAGKTAFTLASSPSK